MHSNFLSTLLLGKSKTIQKSLGKCVLNILVLEPKQVIVIQNYSNCFLRNGVEQQYKKEENLSALHCFLSNLVARLIIQCIVNSCINV